MVFLGAVLGKDGRMAPSDTIGLFGVGNRGSDSIRAMTPFPDYQILAVADYCRERAERARLQGSNSSWHVSKTACDL